MNDLLSERYKKQNEAAPPEPKRAKKSSMIEAKIPKISFSTFGGIQQILKDIENVVFRAFKHPQVYRDFKIEPPKGILLHGPPGCGKSRLAEAIAGELQVPIFIISSPEVVSGMSGESESKIRDIFKAAKEAAPCIILFDEIDSITPKRENSQREMEKRIVAQLLTCIDDLNREFFDGSNLIMILATTSHPDSIDAALRRTGRFDREIKLHIPDETGRAEILSVITNGMSIEEGVDFHQIAASCPGYVAADLVALVREASNSALDRVFAQMSDADHLQDRTFVITQIDFSKATKIIQPSAKREGFATVPDVSWEDIGALKAVRDELRIAVVEPIRNRRLFESFGLKTPCGVLLWGPPGCGKTLLAKAIANESHSNFLSVKGPELINKYVGESEKAIRQVFERARASAPCVIFFDEIDSLCPRRSDNNEASSSRVVNQLLTEMDGVDERRDVYVIAATNRPDMIDPAMTRPGRLDKLLFVNLPSPEERHEILKTISRKIPVASEVDLYRVAYDPRCSGYSGADIHSLLRESALFAIRSILQHEGSLNTSHVSWEHIEMALSKIRPSVSEEELHKYTFLNSTLAK